MSVTTIPGLNPNFNLGEDGSLVQLQDANGAFYDLGLVKGFRVTPKHEDVSLRTLSGGGREFTRVERLGGTGEFTIARQNGQIEAVEIMLQNLKRASQPELYFSIYQTIISPNGGNPTENMFLNCTIKVTDMGDYTVAKDVEQKVTFTYTDMQQPEPGS